MFSTKFNLHATETPAAVIAPVVEAIAPAPLDAVAAPIVDDVLPVISADPSTEVTILNADDAPESDPGVDLTAALDVASSPVTVEAKSEPVKAEPAKPVATPAPASDHVATPAVVPTTSEHTTVTTPVATVTSTAKVAPTTTTPTTHELALTDKGTYSLATFQPGPDHLDVKPSAKTVEVANFTPDDHITLDGVRYQSLRYSFSDKSGAPIGELVLSDAAGHSLQVLRFEGRFKVTDFVISNSDQGVQIGLVHPTATATTPVATTDSHTTATVPLVGAGDAAHATTGHI